MLKIACFSTLCLVSFLTFSQIENHYKIPLQNTGLELIEDVSGDYLCSSFEVFNNELLLIGSFIDGPKIMFYDLTKGSIDKEVILSSNPLLSSIYDSSLFLYHLDGSVQQFDLNDGVFVRNWRVELKSPIIRMIASESSIHFWYSNGNTYTMNKISSESKITKGWTFDGVNWTFINKFYPGHDLKSFEITGPNGTIVKDMNVPLGTINLIDSGIYSVEIIESNEPLEVRRVMYDQEILHELPKSKEIRLKNDIKSYHNTFWYFLFKDNTIELKRF